MERLRLSAWRVREVRMGRAQVSCELVQRVASDEDADWDIEDAVLRVELLDDGATAGGVAFAEDLLEVAVQQFMDPDMETSQSM
jgi:hypothetical protein